MHPAHPWVLPSEPVSRAVLRSGGVTDAMIRAHLAAGRLRVLRHGVYLAAAAWPGDPIGQHLVRAHAEQACNSDAVLSHQSAALIWGVPAPGFERWEELPVSVTFPATGHSSRTRSAVHHVALLPQGQVQRDAAGYAVTTPARTAVDLAAGLGLPEALVVLDGAARVICRSLVPQARRRDYANPRLVGMATQLMSDAARTVRASRLRPALARTDPARESAAESLSAGHFELAGLPTPRFQAELRTRAGVFYPDCLWAAEGVIGECDGALKYENSSAFVLEKAREQALRDLGYRIVRWLAKEIMLQPWLVVDRVARELGR
jgi:very-short-patch-repair endonuclease